MSEYKGNVCGTDGQKQQQRHKVRWVGKWGVIWEELEMHMIKTRCMKHSEINEFMILYEISESDEEGV